MTLPSASILIIDADAGLHQIISDAFKLEGWEAAAVFSGEEALKYLKSKTPDVVLLDISLPEMDGFETCRRIRELYSIPIIMLSARAHEADKVKCFRLGADDYLTKPFGIGELIARAQVARLHKRRKPDSVIPPSFESNEIKIDFEAKTVTTTRQCSRLTRIEMAILHELVNNSGKVLGFDHLISKVWGEEFKGERNSLYVHVNHLRTKVECDPEEPKYIVSVPGMGYVFSG
jgi:DNA-binding response OmpR family regulator